jgi:hypothetical protein
VLDLHRQFAHPNARRVMDRIRDGGGDAGEADLADPTNAQFVDLFVGEVTEMHLELWNIGVYRHVVVGVGAALAFASAITAWALIDTRKPASRS